MSLHIYINKYPLLQWTYDTEKDECESNPCMHDGICNDGLGRYNCTCPDEWLGQNCEIGEFERNKWFVRIWKPLG